MQIRLLDLLRCPECTGQLDLVRFASQGNEITEGVLYCGDEHFFPVTGGIPRMLPSSFSDHWPAMEGNVSGSLPPALQRFVKSETGRRSFRPYDRRTKANFSNEWDNHDIGGRTWTMKLDDRVRWFFLEPIGIDRDDLAGKLMLDAGCGNGSQSVAYTEFDIEVVAVDLSTGLEKGYAFRDNRPRAKPEMVHFVQADLQNPPFAHDSFDIIHSAGVLHHTRDTERTFRALTPLLKEGGTFYVWLYKYEKFVTPLVNSMRAVTTRMPSPLFAGIAQAAAIPFIGFCWTVNKLGIRKYETPDRREAALAVHDIFGAPYAHYHDLAEVGNWFESEGIRDYWPCNDDRRGFGVCGRLPVNGTK